MKYRKMLVLLLLPILLASCWDYKEYEEMALVFSIGIDADNNNQDIRISTEHLLSGTSNQQNGDGMGESGSISSVVHTANGVSISKAVDKLQSEIDRQIFFGFVSIIVIGYEAAMNRMEEITDFLERSSGIRGSAMMLVTSGSALDVISTSDFTDLSSTRVTNRKIYNLINESVRSGVAFPITLQDFFETLYTDGKELVLPHIEANLTGENNKNSQNGNTDGGTEERPLGNVELKNGHHLLSGMAVFKKDKMAGWLDDTETTAWGYITGRKIASHETVFLDKKGTGADSASFAIIGNKSGISFNNINKSINAELNIDLTLELEELTGNTRFIGPEILKDSEESLNIKIKGMVESTIERVQNEFRSDIFSFGFKFFRTDPKAWQAVKDDWDDVFTKMKIAVNVKSKILNQGKILSSGKS